jgi:formate hydrogenlyase transcriptional activator
MPRETVGKPELQEIVGQSRGLESVLRQATNEAKRDSIVLISGEIGTGKELLARAIHRMSDRRTQSFIKLDCSILPPAQLEEALFGYGRGRLEVASQGTLILKHVDKIPREFHTRLPGISVKDGLESPRRRTTIPVDVRLIATTSDTSWLHESLFHELNVSTIRVSALRERRVDIPLLVWYFIKKWSRVTNKSIDVISHKTMKALMKYNWPRNIRELEAVMERAVRSTQGTEIGSEIPIE